MRARRVGLVPLLLLVLACPSWSAALHAAPARALIRDVRVASSRAVALPRTDCWKLDRPGPVRSPDPYFTLRLGDAEIYRDATDHALAYYCPVLRLAKRTGTPLAEGVGELASELDGFRFRYYKFESGGMPKWADMQVAIVAERPAEATLENVQGRWKDVVRLVPLPLRLDASTGVRMTIPYPPRTVEFSQLEGTGGPEDSRWYYLSTNTHPTPGDLLTDGDNNALNEAKARDFVALITSDLSDMPSFQPVLEVRAVFAGWQGASPLVRMLPRAAMKPARLAPADSTKPEAETTTRTRPRTLRLPIMKLAAGPVMSGAHATGRTQVRAVSAQRILIPRKATPAKQPVAAVKQAPVRADLMRVIGTLRLREDVDYTYSQTQELAAQLPITYPKAQTPNYDYYFLSDSGRFGGPYFEPSAQPDRPQRAEAPEGFSGYWYESHFFGRRLVWPAPRELRLTWNVESGLRPTCRFSLSSGEGGDLTAHISYDLYPDLSARQLSAIVEKLRSRTGEQVEVLPFTDLIDANQMALQSGSQAVQDLVASKRLSITKLSPHSPEEAWLRVSLAMPIEDWAAFTLFMKLGELGVWDFGVLTGATSGIAEKVTFQLNADLLQTMGGPVIATGKSFDPAAGGCEVTLDNYGIQPLGVGGLRFLASGEEQTAADLWFDGSQVRVPGVGSASSFDQVEGTGGSIAATVTVAESAKLKTLMARWGDENLSVRLTADMVGPSTASEDAGGVDPDILFSFLRSLCYQYIGSSDVIEVPVAPAEASQWIGYRNGRTVLRFQGFVYTHEIDLAGPNRVTMRRLPREGAYASAGRPGDADLLEYRAIFARDDGSIVHLPPQIEGGPRWLTGDITGVNLDMTQAR